MENSEIRNADGYRLVGLAYRRYCCHILFRMDIGRFSF